MPELPKSRYVKIGQENNMLQDENKEHPQPSKQDKLPRQKLPTVFSILMFALGAFVLLISFFMFAETPGMGVFTMLVSLIIIFSGTLLRKQSKSIYIDTQKVDELEKAVEEEKAKFVELAERKKTLSEMKEEEIREYLNSKEVEKNALEKSILVLQTQSSDLEKELLSSHQKVAKVKEELLSLEDDLLMESFGLYKPRYEFANSTTYQTELTNIRNEQKRLIREKKATNNPQDWTVNGDVKAGKKMIDDARRLMMRAFNNECEAAINKVQAKNIDTIKKRITKSYEDINKLNQINQLQITAEYFDLKISELHLAYEFELKKEEEREILREQREKEREERALQREVEQKKKSIEKEITHLDNAVVELENKLILADSEEERHALENQILEVKDNIEKFKDEQKDLDYRLEHTGAGYVYIISNIGSFGKDIFKIGVTRRLEPMDRIKELGSASVPFQFDVHALIFSYEAYALENELHTEFASKRVNLINNRKEFFMLNSNEIKSILDRHKELTFEFRHNPDAEEYFETQTLRKNAAVETR